jgi:hypothetical protein
MYCDDNQFFYMESFTRLLNMTTSEEFLRSILRGMYMCMYYSLVGLRVALLLLLFLGDS